MPEKAYASSMFTVGESKIGEVCLFFARPLGGSDERYVVARSTPSPQDPKKVTIETSSMLTSKVDVDIAMQAAQDPQNIEKDEQPKPTDLVVHSTNVEATNSQQLKARIAEAASCIINVTTLYSPDV